MTGRPRPLTLALLVTLVLVAGVLTGGAQAAPTTYFVKTSGSDTAGNGSAKNPWRTIAKATSSAPSGSTIRVGSGTYAPFVVRRPGQTIAPVDGAEVVVRGRAGVRDVIAISAANVTVRGLTVTGCVPASDPSGGFQQGGSAGVRIGENADNAVVQAMTIAHSQARNSDNRRFGCFGILVRYSDHVQILDNDIFDNGQGIYVVAQGNSSRIAGNRVHDNVVLIRNTPGGNDDFGAGGIAMVDLDASPPMVVTDNEIFDNSGPSADYGTDGGAFEIYNASHVQMTKNTIYNNENVLESGTSDRQPCTGNTFTDNQAVGRTEGSSLELSIGLILRCANHMRILRNYFGALDDYVFAIDDSDFFSGGVTGLTITGNQIDTYDRAYYLGVYPDEHALVANDNRFRVTGPLFAKYGDGTQSPKLGNWRSRTGLDADSTTY